MGKRVTDTVGTAPVQANENIDLSELRTLNNLEKMKENKDLSPSVNAFVKDLEKVGISPDAALSESMDSNVLRELNSLQSTINKLKTRVPSAANSIPQKFVADPTINFDGYRKLTQELEEARYSMANLESLNIDDVERMKPEWKKKADDDILHHRWNLVEDEEDKEAH